MDKVPSQLPVGAAGVAGVVGLGGVAGIARGAGAAGITATAVPGAPPPDPAVDEVSSPLLLPRRETGVVGITTAAAAGVTGVAGAAGGAGGAGNAAAAAAGVLEAPVDRAVVQLLWGVTATDPLHHDGLPICVLSQMHLARGEGYCICDDC